MHSLIASSDKVKGCELIFPDTAFFRKGKPSIIIRSDPRDFCLMGVRNQKKLTLQSIYKDFQTVVRRRRKDYTGPFGRLYFNSQSFKSKSDLQLGFATSRDFSKEAIRRSDNPTKRATSNDLHASGIAVT